MENLLYFLISLVWLGIGFLSAMKLESEDAWGGLKEAVIFIRCCWIIFWPVTLIGYIITGLNQR